MTGTTAPLHDAGQPTGTPARSAGAGLLGRVRVALGGRDHRAEVAGYMLALKVGTDAEAAPVVDRLLELADSPAWDGALAALAGAYGRLDAGRRERVLMAGHGRWGKVALGVALSPEATERRSLALLLARACDPEATPALIDLLRDADPGVAEAAGDAVESLAERATRAPALDAAARRAVERVVIAGAERFEQHRRREALVALLKLMDGPGAIRAAGPALGALLDDPDHPAHMGLRAVLRRTDGTVGRGTAWVWLARESVRSACIERLGAPSEPADAASVLTRGHLVHNPLRRAALGTGRRRGNPGGRLEITPGDVEAAPQAGLGPVAPLLDAARADEAEIEAALEPLLARPEPLAGVLAARAIDGLGAAHSLSADLCFAGHARAARSGVLRCGLHGLRGRVDRGVAFAALAAAARVGEAGVARAAATWAARLDGLGVSGRERLAADREAVVRELQVAVRAGPLERRLAAMGAAACLGVAASIELELLAVVGASVEAARDASHDAAARSAVRAAASAVGVLAELASPAAQHAVHRCLHHPDMRVRANTLDALTRAARRRGWLMSPETPVTRAVVEFKDHEHHRVRASAVRARLMAEIAGEGGRAAVDGVVPLLTDDRPMHRVAGLWLAERASGRLGPDAGDALAGVVADLVRRDPDVAVRARARRCAAQLLAQMRTRWAGRAASV